MSDYLFLVPISIAMGLIGLVAFLWSLRHEQFDDLDGAAERVLFDDDWPLDNSRESLQNGTAVTNTGPTKADRQANCPADVESGQKHQTSSTP